jgi:1-acyl-sn-glycerol-3-phosphate acyltransferase
MNPLVSAFHTARFWVCIVPLSLVLGVVAIVARLFDASGDLSHNVARLWNRLNCNLNGIGVDIQGMEHVLRDRAQIFVANHQSYFDIFALSGFLPVQIRWMAKASLFKLPFVGWSMTAAGYIPVKREDKRKAYQSFMETVEKIKTGKSVVIFPEGTRSRDGTIGAFKKGGQLLAVRSGAPMVPVTIVGAWKIVKKGSGVIRPGNIRIIISPPVTVEKGADAEETLNRIRDIICKNHERALTETTAS